MRLTASSSRADVTVPLGQAATYEMQVGLSTPGRIGDELYSPASRARVEIRGPSELMGPSVADLALWALPCTLRPCPRVGATIDVLLPLATP